MGQRQTIISVQVGEEKYTVEKSDFNAREAFDDFVNLMFISGTDIEQIKEIIDSYRVDAQKNHRKNEGKADKGPCNL